MTTIDERGLGELVTDPRTSRPTPCAACRHDCPMCRDYANEAGDRRPEPEELARFNDARTEAADRIRAETGANRGGRLVGGALFGAALAAVVGSRASADEALDVQMLQTASSLERLAVNTYTAALGLPFIANGNAIDDRLRHRDDGPARRAPQGVHRDDREHGWRRPGRTEPGVPRRRGRCHAQAWSAPLEVVTWLPPSRRWRRTPTSRTSPSSRTRRRRR